MGSAVPGKVLALNLMIQIRGPARAGPALHLGRGTRVPSPGLRVLRAGAQGAGPAFGGAVPRASTGGRQHPGRHAAGSRRHCRRAAPRRRRRHADHDRKNSGALRRRSCARGRRRDEDQRHSILVERRAPGRELPQNAAGDGRRHPRHPREARRPPAQHAHASHMPEDRQTRTAQETHRHLRAHRQPARHEQDQERARGAVVQVSRSGGLSVADGESREPAQGRRSRNRLPEEDHHREARAKRKSRSSRSTAG